MVIAYHQYHDNYFEAIREGNAMVLDIDMDVADYIIINAKKLEEFTVSVLEEGLNFDDADPFTIDFYSDPHKHYIYNDDAEFIRFSINEDMRAGPESTEKMIEIQLSNDGIRLNRDGVQQFGMTANAIIKQVRRLNRDT